MSKGKLKESPPGFANLRRDRKRTAEDRAAIREIIGMEPLEKLPPDDMPAIDKIKIFALAGFLHRYAGTPEKFESIWVEAFPEEEKGGKA